MKMQNKEYSKNRGFREVRISIFTGSQLLTLEHLISFDRIKL